MTDQTVHPSGSDDPDITAAYDHAPEVLPELIASVVRQALGPPFNYDSRRLLAREVLGMPWCPCAVEDEGDRAERGDQFVDVHLPGDKPADQEEASNHG